MDVSVIAAVGSFVMSERVLKPKATVLFVLGCLLAYDLTTKTHDITSLRVYRGPALLAFTLMMSAYSLRTWRRNGVACDELIFLPGTWHGQTTGVEGPLIELPETSQSSDEQQQEEEKLQSSDPQNVPLSPKSNRPTVRQRRTNSEEFSDSGIAELGSGSMHDDVEDIAAEKEMESSQTSWNPNEEEASEESRVEQSQTLLKRSTGEPNEPIVNGSSHDNNSNGQNNNNTGPVQRWRENHPTLARLGTFFFFRSTSPSAQTAVAYAPSAPAVFGAALDMSMPVLFNFHLFIEAFNHMQAADEAEVDDGYSELPAKILPLIFLSVLIVRTMIPPGRRFRFWGTLKFTFMAPLYQVRFRDEFIGDALTSWVRPGQDLFFALSFYVTVIYGSISGKYNLTESTMLLEESWMLHNVILPSFAILPLWLKYLQTLRQAYDTKRRWPHQGNSLKYLSGTLVIIYAITHPENRTSPWFITSYLLALLFQLCWDIFVDWELFEIRRDVPIVDVSPDSFCARISSFRPSSRFLLNIQMYLVQPLMDQYQRLRAAIPAWGQIQLRQKRLYKSEGFYWKILAFNTVTRFTWMLCFIPAYHVSRNRTVLTSTSDVNSYWGVILPVTEIVRRTFWGFLFAERETLKLMETDAKYSRVANGEGEDIEEEDADSKLGDRSFRTHLLPTWLDNQQQVAHNAATHRAKERDQLRWFMFVVELYVWAGAFIALGCWAASV